MNKRIKLIYVISDIDRAIAFEWIADKLDKSKFDLVFILINSSNSFLRKFLEEKKFQIYHLEAKSKKEYPLAVLKVRGILRTEKPDVIHTHLFAASLIGLTAAWLSGVKSRIHTRHHASQHHMYHPGAIKYDKLVNYFSTKIIAITENVKSILTEKEGVNPSKISVVHHGFDLELFSGVSDEKRKAIRSKYNSSQQFPVVGVISRYTEWKGIQFIIPAFIQLLKEYPTAKLVLANANGNDAKMIKEMLKEIPIENYLEIEFEYDNAALYHLFDVFVHVPINNHAEAFGQTYVEALAAGIPSVVTLSGIARDFIEHRRNALVVEYQNASEIYAALKLLLADETLRKTIAQNGSKDVTHLFSLNGMIHKLETLYTQ